MKIIRLGAVVGLVAVLGIASTIIIRQYLRICSLRESQRRLAAQYQALSVTNASLLSVDAATKDELIRLRQQTSEILSLRSKLTQAREQLAAVATGNQTSRTENSNELAGYVTKEQLRFVGLDTPENAFQSLEWAAFNGDYTNWLAAIAPKFQEEELANPKSLEEFQRKSLGRTMGMQVLTAKHVGSDRVELKVRLDTENSVFVLIFPMVAIGNDWKLGDDIDSYTQAWDSPSSAQ